MTVYASSTLTVPPSVRVNTGSTARAVKATTPAPRGWRVIMQGAVSVTLRAAISVSVILGSLERDVRTLILVTTINA